MSDLCVSCAIQGVRTPLPCGLHVVRELHPTSMSKPQFLLGDTDKIQEVLAAALDVIMDADLIDGEWFGKLVDPEKIDRLEAAIEAVHRV